MGYTRAALLRSIMKYSNAAKRDIYIQRQPVFSERK